MKKVNKALLFLLFLNSLYPQTLKKELPSHEPIDIVEKLGDSIALDSEFLIMIHDSETMDIKTLLFSDQSRLSRDIVVQEQTYRLLSSRGYRLISSENQDSFIEDNSTNHLLRQILGSFCEFDRSSTVDKLRVSRERKRESNRDKGIVNRQRTGKVEGRKRVLEIHEELGSLVLKLRRKGLSLRKISTLLKDEYGYTVSFVSVGNILKDIELMKKEKRRMKRLETVI